MVSLSALLTTVNGWRIKTYTDVFVTVFYPDTIWVHYGYNLLQSGIKTVRKSLGLVYSVSFVQFALLPIFLLICHNDVHIRCLVLLHMCNKAMDTEFFNDHLI